jgi:flagellar biosynthesis protein FliP
MKLQIAIGIAVVTPDWVDCGGGINQLLPVPLRTVVICTATSGAVAARHKLGQMLVTTATRSLHGADVVTIKHVLHRIHTKKAIVIRAVVTVEVIIGVLEIQERHVGFGSCPPNRASTHRIIQSIVTVTSLRHQTTPAVAGLKLALPALTTADLQIALQVGVAEVFPFIVWQQIDGFVGMEEAESTFIGHQVILHVEFLR